MYIDGDSESPLVIVMKVEWKDIDIYLYIYESISKYFINDNDYMHHKLFQGMAIATHNQS